MITLNDSYLAFGSCLVGLGILIAGLLASLFRQPHAPRWTRPEIVALLMCVPVTATVGCGLGYVAYGLYQVAHGDGDPRGLVALAVVPIALALAWRGLRIRQRLKGYAAAAAHDIPGGLLATEPTLATSEKRAAQRPPDGLPGTLA